MRIDIKEEFKCISLADRRLNKRVSQIAEKWSHAANASFPQMTGNWTELKGAYRFMNNERINEQEVLSGHIQASIKRAQRHQSIIAIHDSSEFKFKSAQAKKGLGRLRKPCQNMSGFYGHFSLCASEEGEPLGVMAMSQIVRKSRTRKEKSYRELRGNQPRESWRWGQQALAVQDQFANMSIQVVHVMDREADAYALYSLLCEQGMRFVIRATHNRKIYPIQEHIDKLFDQVETSPMALKREVNLSRRRRAKTLQERKIHPEREKRTATLGVYACPVTIPRSSWLDEGKKKSGTQASVVVHAVLVKERNTPPGEKPVQWVLLTSEPINTSQAIARVVDIYCSRWLIEEYFKAIKTGCGYEKRQLETGHGLFIALAICAVVAWQMLALRYYQKFSLKTEEIFTADEIQVLETQSGQPVTSTEQALSLIAAMGGHLKHNGPPGWLTIYRGLCKLRALVKGFRLAREICVQ